MLKNNRIKLWEFVCRAVYLLRTPPPALHYLINSHTSKIMLGICSWRNLHAHSKLIKDMNIYIRKDLFKIRDVNQKCKCDRPPTHIPLSCKLSQAPGGIPGPKMCDQKCARKFYLATLGCKFPSC